MRFRGVDVWLSVSPPLGPFLIAHRYPSRRRQFRRSRFWELRLAGMISREWKLSAESSKPIRREGVIAGVFPPIDRRGRSKPVSMLAASWRS